MKTDVAVLYQTCNSTPCIMSKRSDLALRIDSASEATLPQDVIVSKAGCCLFGVPVPHEVGRQGHLSTTDPPPNQIEDPSRQAYSITAWHSVPAWCSVTA